MRLSARTHAHTHAVCSWARAAGARCCYDAMATAPWEASEELNEFPPQLEWSSRRQPGHRGDAQPGSETAAAACPSSLHGRTQSGVSASLAASRVMTAVGDISHTSVRRRSETRGGEEAPTPCSPSLTDTKWGGLLFVLYFHVSGRVVLLTCDSVDLIRAPCWTTMAERTSTGLLTMMLEPTPAVAMTLPAEVREKLAELELELSEGTFTRNKRAVRPKHAVKSPGEGDLKIVNDIY